MFNFYEMNNLIDEVIEFDRDNHGTGGRTTRQKAQLPTEDPNSLKDIGGTGKKGDYWMKWMDEPEKEVSQHDGTTQELQRIRDKHGVPGADLARQIYNAINRHIGKFQNKSYTFPQLVHELQGLEIKDVDGSFKKIGASADNAAWAMAIKLLSGNTQPPLSTPVFHLNPTSKTITIAEDHPTLTKSAQEHLARLDPTAQKGFKDRFLDKDEDEKAKPGEGGRYLNQKLRPSMSPVGDSLPPVVKQKLDQEKRLFDQLSDSFDKIRVTGYGGDAEEFDTLWEPYQKIADELLHDGWLKNNRAEYDRVSQNYNHLIQTTKEIWGHIGKISPEKEAFKKYADFQKTMNDTVGNEALKGERETAYSSASDAISKAIYDPGIKNHPETKAKLEKLLQKLDHEYKLANAPLPSKAPASPEKSVQAPSVPTAAPTPPTAPVKPRRVLKDPLGHKAGPGSKNFSGLEKFKGKLPESPF